MSSELVSYHRLLKIKLPHGKSAFLWGARKTGKSTYLQNTFPQAKRYDLLQSDVYLRLAKSPHLLREEILLLPPSAVASPVIIDEVQKIPQLLDEIHWLIENAKIQFILCGSSARKLKHGAANLLGGRAWRYTFYPLVYPEIPQFNLQHALDAGLIPEHYLESPEDAHRSLKAYLQDYLTQEIQGEGLTRNLPAFARFLDAVAFTHGDLTNFSNIARDCAVDAKTVKEYYQILLDTLLGYFIYPYQKSHGRELITATPKFYFFDMGVVNVLTKRRINTLKGSETGKTFEHFILTELIAYRGLNDLDFDIHFWRTKTGLEVDFVLGKAEVAIEVKIDTQVRQSDLKGLIAFQEEHKSCHCYVVSLDPRPRRIVLDHKKHIDILPWETFLQKLWNKEFI